METDWAEVGGVSGKIISVVISRIVRLIGPHQFSSLNIRLDSKRVTIDWNRSQDIPSCLWLQVCRRIGWTGELDEETISNYTLAAESARALTSHS